MAAMSRFCSLVSFLIPFPLTRSRRASRDNADDFFFIPLSPSVNDKQHRILADRSERAGSKPMDHRIRERQSRTRYRASMGSAGSGLRPIPKASPRSGRGGMVEALRRNVSTSERISGKRLKNHVEQRILITHQNTPGDLQNRGVDAELDCPEIVNMGFALT